jgi:hypothetical protein
MSKELAHHRCVGDDGAPRFVREYRHVFTTQGEAGARRHLGAVRLTLLDGEPVRFIDPQRFEVIATGEQIRHDSARCRCARPSQVLALEHGRERPTWAE